MFNLTDTLDLLDTLKANDLNHSTTVIETLRYGMYNEKYSEKIIMYISKQLTSGFLRDKGVILLLNLLPDCPNSVLEVNCVQWLGYVISRHPNEIVSGIRLKLIGDLLTRCSVYQDFYKNVVSSTLSKIIDCCLTVHVKSSDAQYSLLCLQKCLKRFPSACITFKKKIDAYVVQFIDIPTTTSVTEAAAVCGLFLNQIGGKGPGGSLHISNYKEYLEKLCNTLYDLHDSLFENVNEFRDESRDVTNKYEFRKIPSNLNEDEVLRIISRRLRNVSSFIIKALECEYPVKKSFKPESITSVIRRGLEIHVHIDEENAKNLLYSVVIQEHQIQLLHMLRALISCIKQSFIRFYPIKLLQTHLSRTNNCHCFLRNSEYKIILYEVLNYWISNSGEYIETSVYDNIVKSILVDITSVKSTLALKVDSTKTKGNKRKQQENPTVTNTNKDSLTPQMIEIKENICYHALVVLELLLTKVNLTIPDNTCVLLFEVIVKHILEVCANSYEIPYTNQRCRLQLFKTLIAIFNQNKKSLNIGLAVNLLSLGESNSDNEISNCCLEGLNKLEAICQPVNFALNTTYDSESNATNQMHEINTNNIIEEPHKVDILMETCFQNGKEFATSYKNGIDLQTVGSNLEDDDEDSRLGLRLYLEDSDGSELAAEKNLEDFEVPMKKVKVSHAVPANNELSNSIRHENVEDILIKKKSAGIITNNEIKLTKCTSNFEDGPAFVEDIKILQVNNINGSQNTLILDKEDEDMLLSFVDEVKN